VIAQRKKHVE